MFADWYYAYSVLYCFCYVFHYLWDASHPICLSLLAPLILYLKSLVKNFLLKSVHSINLVFKIFSILLDRLSLALVPARSNFSLCYCKYQQTFDASTFLLFAIPTSLSDSTISFRCISYLSSAVSSLTRSFSARICILVSFLSCTA